MGLARCGCEGLPHKQEKEQVGSARRKVKNVGKHMRGTREAPGGKHILNPQHPQEMREKLCGPGRRIHGMRQASGRRQARRLVRMEQSHTACHQVQHLGCHTCCAIPYHLPEVKQPALILSYEVYASTQPAVPFAFAAPLASIPLAVLKAGSRILHCSSMAASTALASAVIGCKLHAISKV